MAVYKNTHTTPLGSGRLRLLVGDTVDTTTLGNPLYQSAVEFWISKGYLTLILEPGEVISAVFSEITIKAPELPVEPVEALEEETDTDTPETPEVLHEPLTEAPKKPKKTRKKKSKE
jgi:hypothetical protein